MADSVRVRMAPAPTGRLHIGTARATLFNWLFARHYGGTFVLRIEDTDQARSSEENVRQILEAIRWLGLDWDEGPKVEGPFGPYFQSQRLPLYQEMANRLLEQDLAYPCFCTPEELTARREEMQRKGLPPRYDRRCRELTAVEREQLAAEGRPQALRFKTPLEGAVSWDDLIRGEIEFQHAELDDFVIVKSDGYPSYILACAVDDAKMAMTHVLRGEDLISGTPRQLLVYEALGLKPPFFGHLPLILGPDRAKLSKRHGATSIGEYRDQGFVPDAIVNFIALLGWSPGDDRELLSREEMIDAFSLEGVGKSGPVFDVEKLTWMNGVYLREMAPQKYVDLALPFLEQELGEDLDLEYVARAVALEQERAKTLSELPTLTEFFFRDPESYDEKGARKWLGRDNAAQLLTALREALEAVETFDEATTESAVRAAAEQLGIGAGPAIHTTRLATTGRTKGPGLFEVLAVLGQARVISRLARAEEYVQSLQA
ncbi:MAG: glutamate--tRNA ligase [Armatimonadetes bacterium]|nr:glutamate--tRNA ligase [Armatimonadota bacterium]